MGTIVIDTNTIAFAVHRKKADRKKGLMALHFLLDVKRNNIAIGLDMGGVIEKEYIKHIYDKTDYDVRIWWMEMNEKNLIYRKHLTERGPYPSKSLSEVDKACLDRAVLTDTKVLVSEDSDFYTDKSLSKPHPVVVERGVNLLKIDQAFDKIQELDP